MIHKFLYLRDLVVCMQIKTFFLFFCVMCLQCFGENWVFNIIFISNQKYFFLDYARPSPTIFWSGPALSVPVNSGECSTVDFAK
jgi:hypothetical protein